MSAADVTVTHMVPDGRVKETRWKEESGVLGGLLSVSVFLQLSDLVSGERRIAADPPAPPSSGLFLFISPSLLLPL